MPRLAFASLLYLLTSDCANSPAWRPVAALPHGHRATVRGGAILLENEGSITADWDLHLTPTYVQTTHQLVEVLDASGMSYAAQRLALLPSDRLLELRARTISADGHVYELAADDVHEENARAGTATARSYTFHFPNVAPGARLESWVSVDHSGQGKNALWELRGPIASAVPTQFFRLEFILPNDLVSDTKTYNGAPPFVRQVFRSQTRLLLEMRDVPAHTDEWLAPPLADDEPWWAYRTRRFNDSTPGEDTWSEATQQLEHFVYSPLTLAGPVPEIDRSLTVARRIDGALSALRASTNFSGFAGSLASSGVKAALARRSANNIDKAIILYATLTKAGVDAALALCQRGRRGVVDLTFPRFDGFDHLLVWVPEQPGLQAPLFIDPSCEACAAGELPPWSWYRTAIVLGHAADAPVGLPPGVSFELTAGKQTATSGRQKITRASVDARGVLTTHVTMALFGAPAIVEEILSRKIKDESHADELLYLPGEWRTSSSEVSCDRATARCDINGEATSAGYAPPASEHWHVPLDFLSLPIDVHSLAERTRDVVIAEPEIYEESLFLSVPPGFWLSTLPSDRSETSSAFSAKVEFRREGTGVWIHRSLAFNPGRYAVDTLAGAARALSVFSGVRKEVLLFDQR